MSNMQNFERSTLQLLEPLSRLIPEKPVFSDFSVRALSVFRCPCCHSMVVLKYQFCSVCGQAIDWAVPDEDKVFPVVLCVPLDQIDAVKRYASQGGEAPGCVALPALAAAVERAFPSKEVPGND